jgi:LCP family protein required for cell wall assembly
VRPAPERGRSRDLAFSARQAAHVAATLPAMAEPSVRDPSALPLRHRGAIAVEPAEPTPSMGRPVVLEDADPGRGPAGSNRPDRRRSRAEPDRRRGGPRATHRNATDRLPTDRRRLVAAIASSLLPGAGQLLNGRLRPALLLGGPTLALIAAVWLIAHSDAPTILLARVVAPSTLGILLVVNVVILVWRAIAVLHAFLDRRYPLRPGRFGALGLAALLAATALPHALAWSYGTAAQEMFGRIFAGSSVRSVSAEPPPVATERLNVLLIGVDSAPGRTEALTDSMIVVSLDPVGRTVSMLSIPRDLASVPLGNGNVFGPKINSLMSWADAHPADYPHGGIRTLEEAVGALLGITIHYYAKVDLGGFATMVDAVGGVDILVKKALDDPHYPGLNGKRGWSVKPGLHHFNGADALAYARIRKSTGESDLTRAARQQEVLVALRNRAVGAGILFGLPKLLDAVGATVRTDLPPDGLPELAALAEQIGASSTTRLVLGSPLIKSGGSTQYGSIFVPVPSRIRAMTKVVFGTPGADPTWPVPSPRASGAGAGGSIAASAAP